MCVSSSALRRAQRILIRNCERALIFNMRLVQKAIACDTPDVKHKCFIYTSVLCLCCSFDDAKAAFVDCLHECWWEVQFYAIHNCFTSVILILTTTIIFVIFIVFLFEIFVNSCLSVKHTKMCALGNFRLRDCDDFLKRVDLPKIILTRLAATAAVGAKSNKINVALVLYHFN